MWLTFLVLEDVMVKLMFEVQAQLELMTLGQQLPILMHPAQKQQLQQLVEHQPMAGQQFPYKTTSGKFCDSKISKFGFIG